MRSSFDRLHHDLMTPVDSTIQEPSKVLKKHGWTDLQYEAELKKRPGKKEAERGVHRRIPTLFA